MARILFVDDDPGILSSLKRGLRKLRSQWDMHFADSPELAIQELLATRFDLVVSDVRMPGKNGFALLADIKVRFPDTAVILMTGMPSIDAAIEAIKLGAADYLTKPFDTDDLEKTIERALAEREAEEKTDSRQTCGLSMNRAHIGDYEIIRQLDEGSMGIVFLAERDVDGIRQKYALKLLKLNILPQTDRPEALARFKREAEIAIGISHPNIIHLYEYGFSEKDEIPYMVMELFEGQSLDAHMANHSLNFETKLFVLWQAANALSEIHKTVTCHRDIKPANIMVNEVGIAKLLDFGIAKLPRSELTQPDCIMGTPAYLAPEAIMDTPNMDKRSDLFSFGVVAFELLLGQRPFQGDNLVTLARQIWQKPAPSPQSIDPKLPDALNTMILRLLEKQPSKRYGDASEVAELLSDFVPNQVQAQ